MRLLYSSRANPRRTIGKKKINLDTTCCNDRLSWLLIRNSGRNRHEPTQPTALRNVHQVLGRSFRTLIGGELGIPHFISHWVVTHGPITLWARGWPAELWRRTLNERGPVTDRPNSWNFDLYFVFVCYMYGVRSTPYCPFSSFLTFPTLILVLFSFLVLPEKGYIPRSGSIILSACLTLCLYTNL